MLALSINVTSLSDTGTTGQPSAASDNADGFLALLNAGGGTEDMWGNSVAPSNSNSSNNINSQANVPTSLFTSNDFSQNSQNANAPAPQPRQQEEASSSANNQTQSAPPAPQQQQQQPQQSEQQQSSSSSTSNNQNANAAAASQQVQDQTNSGNTSQPAKQLNKQIQDQLGNISQVLLSMIQALSASAAQPVTIPVATSLSQTAAAGTDATGSAGSSAGSPTDQEISLLKDMQSLLEQLQQSLSGEGKTGQASVQTLSDSLLADMAKLSQLAQSSDGNSTNSLLDTTQFGNLSDLIKNSITQAQNQLQLLQTSNEALFAQAKAGLQPSSDTNNSSKTTQNNNNVSANSSATTNTTPALPVTPDVTAKPTVDNFLVATALVAVPSASQDGGSSSSNNQDSNQNTQPVVAAATSSSSSASAASSTSFAKVLNQVSEGSVLNQIQFQVKTALGDGSSKISIQLNPPDLGKLDVKLNISADGKASGITIVASNNDTLNLLKQDTQGLTRALNDAGLTTDSGSLNFSLGGGGQNQSQDSQQAATTYQQAQPEEEIPAITTISRSYVVNMTDGLDITI